MDLANASASFPHVPADPEHSLYQALVGAFRIDAENGVVGAFRIDAENGVVGAGALEREVIAAHSYRVTPEAMTSIRMFWSRRGEELIDGGLSRFSPPARTLWIEHDVRTRVLAGLPTPMVVFKGNLVPAQVGILISFLPGAPGLVGSAGVAADMASRRRITRSGSGLRPGGKIVAVFRPAVQAEILEVGPPAMSAAFAEFDLPNSPARPVTRQEMEETTRIFGPQTDPERLSLPALARLTGLYDYRLMVSGELLATDNRSSAIASVAYEVPLTLAILGMIGAGILELSPSSTGPASTVATRSGATGLLEAAVSNPIATA